MKRIAIVEDEVFMREELSDILRKADYQVDEISEFENVAGQLSERTAFGPCIKCGKTI